MSWQWRSGNWWVTHIFVRFSLQGHWETPAWGPELSVLLKSNSHAWPKFAYVWIFGCARVCVCVCFTRWSSTTQASTFGIVLHHKHPTEADSCHLRQMPQSDGTPLCAFLLVWQCVCVARFWQGIEHPGVPRTIPHKQCHKSFLDGCKTARC